MSPIIPGTNPPQKHPISVESVRGYFSLLKDVFGAKSESAKSVAYTKLSEYIHPLVLGDVYRTQKQIQMLAEKLLKMSYTNDKKVKSIVAFLCSDSGSHDYTINRTEARSLGLNVKSPSQDAYADMKAWFQDIANELELNDPYDPVKILGNEDQKKFICKRCLIESIDYGQDIFVSEGILNRTVISQDGIDQAIISTNREFTGWRHC